MTFCGSPPGYTLTRFTRTLEPLMVPSRTYPEAGGRPMSRRESESEQDFGSSCLTLHIFPSSYRDPWNARLAGSEIPTRIYAGYECGVEKGRLETHTVQVLDEPPQILASEVRKSVSVLIPTKEVDELFVELW